ncbi:hypothetical protein [Gemmata sp.]|uniref:hypothetical protein n=1 Tax=Gemmata sp. TaxID=1914242 RepID=UPI003F72574D
MTDAIVTIDATGCQKDIVGRIVAAGGDCVIAVKGNQPKLHTAIEAFFHDQIDRDFHGLQYRRYETAATRPETRGAAAPTSGPIPSPGSRPGSPRPTTGPRSGPSAMPSE